ncbi:MAG: cyclic lactone autoinducer peptide [Bacillota bacterium]
MKRLFLLVLSSMLTLLALANVASASIYTSYQPELPAKLR